MKETVAHEILKEILNAKESLTLMVEPGTAPPSDIRELIDAIAKLVQETRPALTVRVIQPQLSFLQRLKRLAKRKTSMISTIVRILLTISLLVVVWLHSHWSVAFVLTLLSMAAELQGAAIRRLRAKVSVSSVLTEKVNI